MAAVQCNNFVGNAWKKDLCLNCFKSKEEHIIKNGHSHLVPTRIPDPPKEGILKGTKPGGQTPKGNKVIFPTTEFEVIGFGGDDVYSEDEDYPDFTQNSHTEDNVFEEDNEEDKAFQKLTKTNTDFNSIPENLQEPKEGEVKKIVEPLKLGKQLFDDKGNKKTLLVSVTSFGDQTAPRNKITANALKVAFAAKEVNGASNAEEGAKTNGVAHSKLTTEKTETNDEVGNGCAAKSKSLNGNVGDVNGEDIGQMNGEDTSGKLANDKSLKRSQPLDKNFKVRLSKDLQKENDKNTELSKEENKPDKMKTSEKVSNLIDKAKKKVNNQFPVITDNQNFKNKDVAKGKKSTEPKAVVLDLYKIQETEDSKPETNGEKTIKSVLMPPEIRNKFLSSEVKISASMVGSQKGEKVNGFGPVGKVEDKTEKFDNGLGVDRSKLVPNVSSLYRHHFKAVKKDTEEKKTEGSKVVNSMSLVPNIECTFTETNGDAQTKEVCVTTTVKKLQASNNGNNTVEGSKENGDNDAKEEKFKKTPFETFENFEKIIKGEEITLYSAERVGEGGVTKPEEVKLDQEKDDMVPEISRESAGEPDGRADSDDLSEPPALPLKPPPPLTESRSTFLHDLTLRSEGVKVLPEKPKVPAKPIIIQSEKTNFLSPIHTNRPKSPSVEKFLDSSPQVKPHPPLQESLSSDSSKNQKRPAPKPPSPKEDPSERYAATPVEVESDDSGSKQAEVVEEPVTRETVRRISRSTENLLEFITDQEEKEILSTEGLEEITVPEPVPRRSLSLSQDSLVPCEIGDVQSKKKPSRGRFFLRKLLHLGKAKETSKEMTNRQKCLLPPTPKPKLEIIHPSDLNGSRVEVVPPARTSKSRRTSSSASSSSGEQRESDVLSDSSTSHSASSCGNDSQSTIDRSKKPPPPPRAHSLDTWSIKPARPPPPKSIDILRQVNSSSWCTTPESKSDNLYVNLGEARSGLAPNKPVRTGSLREANMESSKILVPVTAQPEDSDYESFVVSSGQYSTPSPVEDNVYECVQVSPHRSSLPECDSGLPDSPTSTCAKGKRSSNARNNSHRRSEGNVELNSDYFKMKFMRSVSLPYCASETESEIYSPYSFYGSELGEEDYESTSSSQALRMSRLKLKKGRSIVHKNLEDNYGAVIVANHEALAQVVEQMRQGPSAPPALRALTTAVNLRWTDFTIAKDAEGVIVERRVFYPALWGTHSVTLSLMAEKGLNSSLHVKGPFNLNPLTELNDLVPASYLPMLKKDDSELIQASISVLTRLQIETIETYGKAMNTSVLSDEAKKEVNFILLQIINAFKSLQAQGIEEAPKNLSNLLVCREEKDPHPRICITHSFERSEDGKTKSSLCQCVTHAIKDILPPTDLTPLISNVLLKEKAVSLSQAKSILEFSLWGPADIAFGNSSRERESALQRWLDLERATVLHGLVRTRAELTVFEEWQLLFLVRTNAKMMAEASLLLESGTDEEVSTA